MERQVYCVFEGGGAKGVAHVGALRAIHEIDYFKVRGYAGSSAGAIVAALAATGWQADELLCIDGDGVVTSKAFSTIGEHNARSLADLFGTQWKTLSGFRSLLNFRLVGGGDLSRQGLIFTVQFLWIFAWPLIYLHVKNMFALKGASDFPASLVLVLYAVEWIIVLAGWAVYLAAACILVRRIINFFRDFKGLANLDHVVLVLDRLLSEKTKPTNGSRVCFKDILDQKGIDLKIVAANVRTGEMTLFDAVNSPNVAVADAVVASAAIPFIFEPVEINREEYCDGGLVSNLPAWSFDPEILLDKNCLVITCELPEIEIGSDKKELAGLRLMKRVARTAVFGAGQLNTRGLSNHLSLSLSPELNILDFDETERQIEAVLDAENVSRLRIEYYLLEQESVRSIHNEVLKYVEANSGCSSGTRTAAAREVQVLGGRVVAYRLWYRAGFEDSLDGEILLPLEGTLVALCRNECKWQSAEKCNKDQWEKFLSVSDAQRLVPQDREWVIALPLKTNLEYHGEQHRQISVALTIDSPHCFKGDLEEHVVKLREIVDKHGCFTPY